ncbi:MAG: gluconokinase [Pseudobacter sp.]|uniref:gluconokinase n=1 Tax=Pseudobacter sp. TaxID=2045420 RepID=UPI003F7E15E4
MRFFIGADIGTTHTKAIALQSDGFVLASAMRGYTPLTDDSGKHELDPEQVFRAVLDVLEEVAMQLAQKTDLQLLSGIAFSSAMHSLIVLDENFQPLSNCITWADLRSSAQAERLKAEGLATDLYRHTGTPVHPMSPLCKLIWLRETNPVLHQQGAKFTGIKEYVLYRLTGRNVTDLSIASATGLFDIRKRGWYAPALQLAGISEDRLSEPVITKYMIAEIRPAYAKKIGIPSKTPVVVGASDGCLANLGSNALEPGDLSITIGTSGAVRAVTAMPATDSGSRVFNYILDEAHFVCGGPLNNGGALVEWYAEHFLQRNIREEGAMEWFMQQAASVPAGSEGLLFLPYVRGERAPVWDGMARGALVGMDHRHTREHAMRAVVEGINYAVCDIMQAVQQTVGKTEKIFVSGGFIRSPQWVQWLCNLLGQRLVVTGSADASAMGAAILGFMATGEITRLSDARKFFQEEAVYEPDAATHGILQQYYTIYAQLYSQLQPGFQALGKLRNK